ncbi:MAG: DUF4339 domain-containing protein [Puniceicoccales bacterium]
MADLKDKIWYYSPDGSQMGPLAAEELKGMVDRGDISPETPVWRTGMENWQPAAQVTELGISAAPAGGSLKLGATRKYDKINLKEDTSGNVNVQDMIQPQPGRGTHVRTGSRLLDEPKVGFFESIGLGSFEAAFFAIVLVLSAIACLLQPVYWHAIVMGAGLFTFVVAEIAWIVRAFLKHWAWGLAVFFFFFPAALIYLFFDLRNAGKSLVLMLVGIAAIITPITFPSFRDSPVYKYYEVFYDEFQAELERQQQEIEQTRSQQFDQFGE